MCWYVLGLFFFRTQLLEWVNYVTQENYGRIEDLSSGCAYCKLFNVIFPGGYTFSDEWMYTLVSVFANVRCI